MFAWKVWGFGGGNFRVSKLAVEIEVEVEMLLGCARLLYEGMCILYHPLTVTFFRCDEGNSCIAVKALRC